jgi:predicted house-cleaning noncanonical NTP pyrophosphatase (MazG superfamily)
MNYYNTNFICTYHMHDDDINNNLYRIQLLQAFNMEDYNDDIINKKINNLHEFLKNNNKEYLNQIINIIKNNNNLSNFLLLFDTDNFDDKMYFQTLFMFDLFYLAHKFFCELIDSGIVKKNTISNLITKIENTN